MSKAKPQVIDDEEHERVHERVAAVDVAKDTGMVCTRLPHPSRPGSRQSTVWTVRARMGAIGVLGRQLARDGIEVVTLESTSDYWRIWFYRAGGCGLAVQLVNAAQARNLPGRPKTDKLDAMWLARLTEMGLLRPSFVPPGDPGPAGLHPGPHPADPGADPLLPAAGKAAGRRLDQAVQRGQQADHRISQGHDQGHDRRGTRPAHAGRPGPHPDEGQARRPGRGPGRHVR